MAALFAALAPGCNGEHPVEPAKKGDTIEYVRDDHGRAEAIKVLDDEGKEIFLYTIEEFKSRAKALWEDTFKEPPAFVEEEPVNPEDFTFFDETAALSPDGENLAFSVHRYFAASYISFTGVVTPETEETALINEENRGEVDKLIWSFEGEHLAYTLHTAKGEGTYLSNDNVLNREKEFTLSGDDIDQAGN